MTLRLRRATADDAELVLELIHELAVYEKEPDAVETNAHTIRQQLAAEKPPFECVIAESDGTSAGMALFFQNYSTWRGRPGLYLEDLFVRPSHRRKGVGLALLQELARLCIERGYGRMEWAVLDWNELAMHFYDGLGAKRLEEWRLYRLTGDSLRALAGPAQRQSENA